MIRLNEETHRWSINVGHCGRRGRGGRGRGRGLNKCGGWSGKNNPAKSHQPILPELIEPNKVFVGNINKAVTNEVLGKFLNQFAPIVNVTVIRKQGNAYRYNPIRPFGFVQLANEEDTQKILNLEKANRVLYGNCMEFKPAKRQFKLPGTIGFKRVALPERDFDLEPANTEEPCIHSLIDDVVLRVFEYLPLKNLLCVERVCRRWQSLVHTCFRKKACQEIKGDLNLWLMKNQVTPSFSAISKVLILCGETMTELSVGEVSSHTQGKLLRVIAQLCPALESLTLSSMALISNEYLQEFVTSCTKLKQFQIKEQSSFNESNLHYILTRIPNLEELQLEEAEIQGKCFNNLPSSLKVLNISRCSFVEQKFVANIPQRCPLLEVLRLEGVCIPSSMLLELSKNCPNLMDLGVEITGVDCEIEMSSFENLKKLSFFGYVYSVNKLIKSLPQLEELKLDGLISESITDVVDFSVLPHLRSLVLPWNNRVSFSSASLKTISYCSDLEKFKFKGNNEHKTVILEMIRRCHHLKELDCPTITLCGDDIDPFVEANKKRHNRLKFVIGLDKSALDQIEKLNDANYDVDMFDVHNLFSDFEAYDEYEDDLDDFYYESEGSTDSDEANFFFLNDDFDNYHGFINHLGLFFPHGGSSDSD